VTSFASTPWKRVFGADLVELVDSHLPLTSVLDEGAAVYVWKQAIIPSPGQRHEPSLLVDWLDTLCTSPRGETLSAQLSHFIHVAGVEIRGRPLTADKRQVLQAFARASTNRRWLLAYLRGIEQHMPALYVGEAEDLPARVQQHMQGVSDFGALVNSRADLDWGNLNLHYVTIPLDPDGKSTSVRRAIEYLTASLAIAGFTRRPG
jgi:hypothetical protein